MEQVIIFREAIIDNTKNFLKPYLKRLPTNKMLHIGANNSISESPFVILNKLFKLKLLF